MSVLWHFASDYVVVAAWLAHHGHSRNKGGNEEKRRSNRDRNHRATYFRWNVHCNEPEQVAKGRDGAEWTGIRNFSAQNHLRAMKKGEQAFFYHTGKERAIVGIVKVIAEAHPDSTDSAWRAVDVAAVRPLLTPVSLEQIKANQRLAGMVLVRLARLSVQPVTEAEWQIVCKMGGLD